MSRARQFRRRLLRRNARLNAALRAAHDACVWVERVLIEAIK